MRVKVQMNAIYTNISECPKIWASMKARCSAASGHKRYYDRGIRVCDAWVKSFSVWYAYMGPRPTPNHSIDRIDNDGHYEPGNVRWATPQEQAQNQERQSQKYALFGDVYTLTQLSHMTGISKEAIRCRLARGMTIEKACSFPSMYVEKAVSGRPAESEIGQVMGSQSRRFRRVT